MITINTIRKIGISLSLIFLFSCTGATDYSKSENEFSLYLGSYYKVYAEEKKEKGDKDAYELFDEKMTKAFKGIKVYPETPEAWDIKLNDTLKEFNVARNRMLVTISSGDNYFKTNFPKDAAKLQFLYDCWIDQEHKSWKLGNEEYRCKVRFFNLLEYVETEYNIYLSSLNKKDEEAIEVARKDDIKLSVYFDYNSDIITKKSLKKMVKILKFIDKTEGDYGIIIEGNTDRSGKQRYNKALGKKRANVIAEKLMESGVPRDYITIKSFGERNPDIITRDEVKEIYNRRVDIIIRKKNLENK